MLFQPARMQRSSDGAAEQILELIRSGQLSPEQCIPSERELEEISGLSRITVRRALSELEAEGYYLRREQGRGTFVARPRIRRGIRKLISFTREMRARGFEPGYQLLRFAKITPPRNVAQGLGLPRNKKVLVIERLRYGDGEPIALAISHLSLPTNVAITEEEVRDSISLYVLVESKAVFPSEADKTLEAIVASDREARLLGIKKGTPLLSIC